MGLRGRVTYEGQAAMELEALAEGSDTTFVYPFAIVRHAGVAEIDFRLMVRALVEDLAAGRPGEEMARAFHNTIALAVADLCGEIRAAAGLDRVVLSGGVFQNKLLTEGVVQALVDQGFHVYTHRLVPPNDGGLALGQAIIAGYAARKGE
jgi:hydrogenase maturation protein HypF